MASLSALKPSASEEDLVHGGVAMSNPVNVQKFPIRRLKPAILKFQKVLQIDLDRLEKHRNNIDKLIAMEHWEGLHKEQVNASRTVQQVKATLRELERTRAQVFDEELDLFDEQMQEPKVKAVAAVESFMRISQVDQLQPDINYTAGDEVDSRESTSLPAAVVSPMSLPVMQTHVELHVVPENMQAAASGEELLKDMEELNDLVHHFADVVKQQGEAVDRIEDNIEQTHDNVREGTTQLSKASKYKMAMFPVMGALIGGAVAGPVGLLAGAKIAGLAGVVGGGMGFAGGKFMKSRHNRVVTMEMSNLSQKDQALPHRSVSTPELSSPQSPDEGTSSQQCADGCDQSFFKQIFSWGQRKAYSESSD